MSGVKGLRFKTRLAPSLAAVALIVTPVCGGELSIDFQASGFDNDRLRLFGDGAIRAVKPGPEGLVMRLPDGPSAVEIGVGPVAPVRGDFEITAVYEIKAWRKPEKGFGTGPAVYVSTAKKTAASIGHVQRPKEGLVFKAHAASDRGGEREQHVRFFPAQGQAGALRLTRSGDRLTYAVAAPGETAFRPLYERPFSADDVGLVRVGVTQDPGAGPTEVVWKSLTVRSEDGPAGGAVASSERRSGVTWLIGFAAVGAVALAAVVAGIRRSR